MADQRHRPRRTVPVVILDAVLGVLAALQTGHLPGRGRERGGRERDELDGESRPDRPRRAAVLWTSAAVVAVVAGTVSLAVAFVRSPEGLAPLGVGSPPPAVIEQPPAGDPSASAVPGSGGFGSSPPPVPRTGRATPTPGGSTASPPPGTATPKPLAARYATTEGGQALLVGYRATVTVTNPGATAVRGWRVTVTLPRKTLTVAEVSGAVAKQDGTTWTFTPAESTTTVPPGGSIQVSFRVGGATLADAAPTGCTIDGRACQGLPGQP